MSASADDTQATMPMPPDWRSAGGATSDALHDYLRRLDNEGPLITDAARPDPEARYVIGREIGAGAACQVLDAYDRRLRRHVALKILHLDPAMDRDRLMRFVAEAQVTSQLDHTSVPPVYEIGRMPGGMPYFAMRLVPGQTLEELLARLRVGEAPAAVATLADRLTLFLRICDGMAHAHGRGVVHRDLKPANMIVAPNGRVNIMDWGLAKVAGGSWRGYDSVATFRTGTGLGTLDGAIAGTPAYMAPEQAWGNVDLVAPAADVYALGLLLAELLTLYRVRREATRGEMLSAVRTARTVEVNDLGPGLAVPSALAAVVRRATHPEAGQRPADAGALAEEVREAMKTLGSATPDRGRPWLAAAAAGAALGALAAWTLARWVV